jgi:hypothetical protein
MKHFPPRATAVPLACAAAATVLMFCQTAAAVDYVTTRDTFIHFDRTDFRGNLPTDRVGKFQQDAYLADFDRAAVRTQIESALGQPLTSESQLAGVVEIHWLVKAVENTGFNTDAQYRPSVYQSDFQGSDNWVELESNYTQAANGVPWHDNGGTPVGHFFDGVRFPFNDPPEAWGAAPETFRDWLLDDAVAFALLNDPDAVGLTFNHADGDNNGFIYAREAAADDQPFLRVLVVPEPASAAGMSLVAAAGFVNAATRRRRR